MRPKLSNHPFCNPFYNRFNYPVHRRYDDVQAYAAPSLTATPQTSQSEPESNHSGQVFAGAFALIVVLLVSAVLLVEVL